jgi:hypothetical protein
MSEIPQIPVDHKDAEEMAIEIIKDVLDSFFSESDGEVMVICTDDDGFDHVMTSYNVCKNKVEACNCTIQDNWKWLKGGDIESQIRAIIGDKR